jgi:beta-phosphoglucomutase-like phosphatase (HAD superfamily)
MEEYFYVKFSHVIFDIDGVLVDSLHANHVTLMETIRRFGFAPDESEIMFTPVPTTEKLAYLERTQGRILNDNLRKAFAKCKYDLMLEKFDLIEINPHATKCITDLIDSGVSVSYVSNARSSYINLVLARMSLTGTSTFILGNDSNFKHKPHPEMFLHVAAKVNINTSDILVVDDYAGNLESVKECGFQTLKINNFDDVLKIKGSNESNYTNGGGRQ